MSSTATGSNTGTQANTTKAARIRGPNKASELNELKAQNAMFRATLENVGTVLDATQKDGKGDPVVAAALQIIHKALALK